MRFYHGDFALLRFKRVGSAAQYRSSLQQTPAQRHQRQFGLIGCT